MTDDRGRLAIDKEMIHQLKVVAIKRRMTLRELAELVIGNFLDDEANKGERE